MLARDRPEVLDAFWGLAAARQNIYFRRLEGSPPPWTADPILETYKFCNAYRVADRVSQYLIREVIYSGRDSYSAEDQILRIVLFRLFSRPQTWELLCAAHEDVTMKSFRTGGYGATLEREFQSGGRLYTPAFILCATPAYGYQRKHRNHLALLNEMLRPGGLSQAVARAQSLAALVSALREYPLIGPFMAYQIAIDINYSELCDFDESEYTIAGPGAKRGVAKCFTDTSGSTPEEIIADLTARQAEEFAKRDIDFKSLFGRPLQAIDIQNLFCELDKYARVAFPELRSNRSRIKTRFHPSGELPPPVFPPKWGLEVASGSLQVKA